MSTAAVDNSQAARTSRRAQYRRSWVLSAEALAYEQAVLEELRQQHVPLEVVAEPDPDLS